VVFIAAVFANLDAPLNSRARSSGGFSAGFAYLRDADAAHVESIPCPSLAARNPPERKEKKKKAKLANSSKGGAGCLGIVVLMVVHADEQTAPLVKA